MMRQAQEMRKQCSERVKVFVFALKPFWIFLFLDTEDTAALQALLQKTENDKYNVLTACILEVWHLSLQSIVQM
jgi:hypothetical protein